MSKIDDQVRDDYKQGQHDRDSPGQGFRDFLGQHPDSDAYYKGRDNEELDGDKED